MRELTRVAYEDLTFAEIKHSAEVKMQIIDALPREVRQAIYDNALGVNFKGLQLLRKLHREGASVQHLLNVIAANTARLHRDLVAKGLTPP